MNSLLVIGSLLMAALCVMVAVSTSNGAERAGTVLAHDVFFTLNESTPETRKALVDACETYLKGHEGTVFFAAGTRATENRRDVNDTGFDVSLHVYFGDEAAHQAYQEHPRHKEFIQKMQANWKTVRVFDSWVRTSL
jgi:hypothetical protein